MWLKVRPFLYVFLAFLQAGFTSGINYGWPPLQQIFFKHGVYAGHCKATDPKDVACPAQLDFYNLIYTIAVFVNNAAPLITGVFLDLIGPKWTNVGSAFLFFLGCGLFALPYEMVYLVAFALLGLAGPGIYCSIMHLCNLFPGHQSSVLSFFSGTFSASSFIFKVFGFIYKPEPWRNISYLFVECITSQITFIDMVLLSPLFIVGAFIWPNKAFEPPGKKSIVDAGTEEEGVKEAYKDSTPHHTDEKEKTEKKSNAEEEPLINPSEKILGTKRPSLYNVDVKKQFATTLYWVPVAWLAMEALNISCCNLASNFTTIWSFGWVAIPVFGALMDNLGNIFSMNVTSVGLILFSALKFIPYDNVQYITFALVSTVNVGMWAIFYSYLSHKFGFDNYGKLLGVSSVTVASVGAFQYLFEYTTTHLFHGSYFITDAVFLVLSLLSGLCSFYLWYKERPVKPPTIIEYYPPINTTENN